MNQNLIQVCLIYGLLGGCAYEDIKTREIKVFRLLIFGILGIVLHLIFRNITIIELLGGMAIGLALMILSRITKNNIGLGDGVLLMITGIYLGVRDNLKLVLIGMLLASIYALFLLIICKKNKKYKIAFVPCLLAAYILISMGG